jgi:thioesterase domain-containing protein
MRTSLNKLFETEQYLAGQLSPEDQLLYEALLIVDTDLSEQTRWQKHTYDVIRAYGRMELKDKLDRMHQQLMTEPQHRSFRNKIRNIFSI